MELAIVAHRCCCFARISVRFCWLIRRQFPMQMARTSWWARGTRAISVILGPYICLVIIFAPLASFLIGSICDSGGRGQNGRMPFFELNPLHSAQTCVRAGGQSCMCLMQQMARGGAILVDTYGRRTVLLVVAWLIAQVYVWAWEMGAAAARPASPRVAAPCASALGECVPRRPAAPFTGIRSSRFASRTRSCPTSGSRGTRARTVRRHGLAWHRASRHR